MRLVRTAETAPEMEQWAVDALQRLTRRFRRLESAQKSLGLTDRQMQVLMLVHEAYNSHEIGIILSISTKTAEKFREQVRERMRAKNTVEAVLRLERLIQGSLHDAVAH